MGGECFCVPCRARHWHRWPPWEAGSSRLPCSWHSSCQPEPPLTLGHGALLAAGPPHESIQWGEDMGAPQVCSGGSQVTALHPNSVSCSSNPEGNLSVRPGLCQLMDWGSEDL